MLTNEAAFPCLMSDFDHIRCEACTQTQTNRSIQPETPGYRAADSKALPWRFPASPGTEESQAKPWTQALFYLKAAA